MRSVCKKTRRKTSILKLQSVKFEEVSHEMLVLMLQHVSSRVAGFCGAVAVSMGEAAKRIFVECFKTGCHVVLRGRRGTLVAFQHVSRRVRSRFVWQTQYFCNIFRRCVAFFVAGAALWTPPMSFCVAGAALSTCRVACFLRIALSALREAVTRCKFRGRGGILSQVMKNDGSVHIDFK